MIKEYFEKLRFDNNNHLGLGDLRLTVSQQEEVVNEVKILCEEGIGLLLKLLPVEKYCDDNDCIRLMDILLTISGNKLNSVQSPDECDATKVK
jgi:hypothetical protein